MTDEQAMSPAQRAAHNRLWRYLLGLDDPLPLENKQAAYRCPECGPIGVDVPGVRAIRLAVGRPPVYCCPLCQRPMEPNRD